ncbi:MAG: RNA polymerase sigma factor, partial [Chloroflexota bacterium]|nr:RNA polymerase sigma factor [Chloroflexota bacterium]
MVVLATDSSEQILSESSQNILIDEAIRDVPENPEFLIQRQIVARALRGEQEAFTDMLSLYGVLMLRTACMIVGNRDIAEDIVQDALIQAWHHLPHLREASALRPWLMRIVVNQAISFKRRMVRSTAFIRQTIAEQEADFSAQIADDSKGYVERNWDLTEAIEHLPEQQRV